MPSREMTLSAKALEMSWINVHGSPSVVSVDAESFNQKFSSALRYFDIEFDPRPARRPCKLGVLERKNSIVRTLRERLLMDSEYLDRGRDKHSEREDILSRAVYLSNVLHGSLSMSSFELARGYTPALLGVPQTKTPSYLFDAHNEQIARRALSLFQRSRIPKKMSSEEVSKGDAFYFFKHGVKIVEWESSFVRDSRLNFAVLCRKAYHAGKHIRSAYEDIQKSPTSLLLQELVRIDFIFPRSYSFLDEDYNDIEFCSTS